MTRHALLSLAVLALAGCGGPSTSAPGAVPSAQAPAPVEFDAVGTEPFWAVQVRPSGLTLSRPDYAELKVAARGPETRGRTQVWTAEGMTVAITPGACSDGMSDRNYVYEAEVRVGEQVLKGCAYKPGAAPTATRGS